MESQRTGAVDGGPRLGRTRRWPNTPFYYGWVIVAVVFLAEFTTSGMGGSTISLFFKPMTDSLGWSLTSLVGAVTAQSIAGMVIALVFLLGVWWRQVRVHDRLIKEGRKDEIGDEMRR